MPKTTVGVIFGGRSVEHEISIITARQLLTKMDKEKYNIVPLYISKKGEWYTGEELFKLETYKNLANLPASLKKVCLLPYPAENNLISLESGFFKKGYQEKLDVVIPALHGSHGEDGCIQGLFELADLPYAGSGVLGSALGMDKISMKAILKAAGLPMLDYLWFSRRQWESTPEEVMNAIESKFKYPVFIKPSDLGSSIGVKRANNRDELCFALDVASAYTQRLLVEKALTDCLEINCSVLGDEDCQASVCEQPVTAADFLTYEDKYLRGDSKQGMAGTKRIIPAPISPDLSKQIQEYALKTFKELAAKGVARIDFLIEKATNNIYINEINTIPGSFAFYLWEHEGLSFSQLIDRMIDLAFKANQAKKHTTYTLEGNLLQKISPK